MASKNLDPLREFLDAVLTRIEVLEAHCGVSAGHGASSSSSTSNSATAMQKTPSGRHLGITAETPSLKAYDKFLHTAVCTLSDTCDDLGGMGEMGQLIVKTFEGIRYVIILASRAKMPAGDLGQALQPHVQSVTDAVKEIRALRLDRDYDNHCKSVMEMLTCVSWVYMRPPRQLPGLFIKECTSSSDFWSNRIRKEFKGKDDEPARTQIKFCDQLKTLMQDLAVYVQDNHNQGLTFNPKGVSLEEAAVVLTDNPIKDAAAAAAGKQGAGKRASIGNTVKGGNILGLMSELSSKKNTEGTSAATGLKHVTKDQQTWRKEFKEGGPAPKVVIQSAPPVKKVVKKKPTGLPILEYQERGTKWIIENQTKESALKEFPENGILQVEITDPKQQVYIFNCEEVSVQIKGPKLKSVILDSCSKVNVQFETIISGCELVNCKKVAIQADGICPVFTIDKTIGAMFWLSEATVPVSSFATSLSSEMNVSIPDGDDRKEIVIPEQFVHKLDKGSLSSEVSDLYH